MAGGRGITNSFVGYAWLLITVLLAWTMQWKTVFATQADEQNANKVEIKIYMLSVSDWNHGAETTFATSVATAANTYCGGSDYANCEFDSGWDSSSSFNESDVVNMTTAVFTSPRLSYEFALNYPSGSSHSTSSLTYVISKSALKAIVESSRDSFYDATGKAITHIDGTSYGIPPNRDLNIIISVVAVLITLILLFTCLILRRKCGGKPEPVMRETGIETKTKEMELQSVTTANSIKPMMVDTPGDKNGSKQILVASADAYTDTNAGVPTVQTEVL